MILPNQNIRGLYVILPLSSAEKNTTKNIVNTTNVKNQNNENSTKTLLLTADSHNDVQQGIFQSSNNTDNYNYKFHIQYTKTIHETLEILSNTTECCFDILVVSITEYYDIIISNNNNKPLQVITEVNDLFKFISRKFPSTLRIVSYHNHKLDDMTSVSSNSLLFPSEQKAASLVVSPSQLSVNCDLSDKKQRNKRSRPDRKTATHKFDFTGNNLSSISIMPAAVSQSMNVTTNILHSIFLNKGRADAVIDSYEQLEKIINFYYFYREKIVIESTSTKMNNSHNNDTTNNNQSHELLSLSSCHIPSTTLFQITQDIMKQREVALRTISNGITTFRIQQRVHISTSLQRQMNDIDQQQQQQNMFLLQQQHQHNDNRTDDHVVQLLRIVHVSDTHNQHRNIHIPSTSYGDLFIHSGDICGYYHHSTNIVQHFHDFLLWLHTDICPYFHRVIFIGGNHDIYLDPLRDVSRSSFNHKEVHEVLQLFLNDHPNVTYLYNQMIQYNGLNIYGTPFVPCRQELLNKRYLSDGFERTKKERIDHWKNHVPKNMIDILITHCPPANIGVTDHTDACPIMTQYIYNQESTTTTERKYPILHCFGHMHGLFGIYSYRSSSNINNNDSVSVQSRTILFNGSQPITINGDPVGGGVPLVIDLPFTKQSHK